MRAEPLEVHYARVDKAATNFHKAQELQRLEARIDTMRKLLETPRPASVTSELKRSLEAAESGAKSLRIAMAEGANSFMRPSPPITILKNNGSVVAALLDSRSHDGVMAIDQAQGFWCRDLKNVEGAWYPRMGFYTAEYCEQTLRQIDGDRCRQFLELDFPGKVMPVPTPTPGVRAIDPNVKFAPKPVRAPNRPTVR